MKKVTQYKYLMLVLFLVGTLNLMAQDYRKTKTETRVFSVDRDAELKVINKYGQIQLIPWEKDSIEISVKIEVRDKKESKAKSTLNDIEIDFISFKSYIESTTSFNTPSSIWGDLIDATGSLFTSESKTMIDYVIHLPSYTHLTIENKYGDIFMDEHKGTTNIILANGDLRARALHGPTSVKMEFAYANIKEILNGSLNLDHRSELRIAEAGKLKIDSRSSRIRIDEVKEIEIKSYRDKYELEKVGTVEANNAYSYLDVHSLNSNVSIDARYGSIDIGEIDKLVKKLEFSVENTDISIMKPFDRSITVDAVYGEDAGLYFPSEMINKKTTMEDEDEKLVRTIGMVGDSFVSPLILKITMPKGNLRVK